jgi:hypothetical protein
MDFPAPAVRIKQEPGSPPSVLDDKGRRTKTLEGKKAGLQDKETLRQENEAFRRRERAAIEAVSEAFTLNLRGRMHLGL